MFEENTYENILNRVLSRVDNGIDKREGSVIYSAVAPVCAELAQAYIREVVEGLGDPPDLQGRRRGEGDSEVSRGEDVIHARRRESQNPQERYAEQLARLDGGQELAHLGAGDVLELVAGDEEHPDRHEDVEDPRCGAFVLFDEVGDSLHVPLVF